MSKGDLFRRNARLFSFMGVLVLTSSLVLLLFEEARAVSMEFDDPASSFSSGASQAFYVDLTIPQGERLPINFIDAVVERQASGASDKLGATVVERARCAMNPRMDCTGSAISTIGGTAGAVSRIRVVSVTASNGDAVANGYHAACPCTITNTGYGYDQHSPAFSSGLAGYGYGYKIPDSVGYGYSFTSGNGYGYASDALTIRFEVTLNGASTGVGTRYLTLLAVTGSNVIGEISSPFTTFTVTAQSASTGGGGGGGASSGATTVTPSLTTTGGVTTASAALNNVAAGGSVNVPLSNAHAALGTLSLTFGNAVSSGNVEVKVSTTPSTTAVAVPTGFGSFLYLDISVPAGASVSVAKLSYTLTNAQLGDHAAESVLMLRMTTTPPTPQATTVASRTADGVTFESTFQCCSPFAVAFDEAPPTVSDLRPPDGSGATTRPLLAAKLADNRGIDTARTRMTVDGQAVSATVTGSEILYTPSVALTTGTHTVRVTAVDQSGLTTERTWTFTAAAASDTAPPTVTPVSPPRDGFTNAASPAIEASYGDNIGIDTTTVTVTIDGAPVLAPIVTPTSVRATPAAPLAEGRHTVTVTVSDTSGNANFATWAFTVDTTAPTVEQLRPAAGAAVGLRPTIGANCADAASGPDPARSKLYLDGAEVPAAFFGNAVSYTPTADLAAGERTVRLVCADQAGNEAERTWTFSAAGGPTPFPWLLVAAVLVVLVAVGAAGYWYMNKKQ